MIGIGIHPGIPADEYHALPYCSNSGLTKLDRSPAHLKEERDNPKEPTPALILGDAVHLCTLQPELFDSRYVVAGRCVAKTEKGKPCSNDGKRMSDGKWFCGVHLRADHYKAAYAGVVARYESLGFSVNDVSASGSTYLKHPDGRQVRASDHPANVRTAQWMMREDVLSVRVDLPPHGLGDGRRVISGDDYDKSQRMRDSIHKHPRARELLAGEGENELTGIYHDPVSGVLVKMRLDRLSVKFRAIVDIKTTQDARRKPFERSIFDFGYHRQGSGYLRGLEELRRLGLTVHTADVFAIIAVESEPPHNVKVYQLDPEAIQRGLDEMDYLLGVYADCERSGRWPGYEDEIEFIGIPAWEMKKGLVTA